MIYDRQGADSKKTILTTPDIITYWQANPICIDGDELFVVDHWASQIQVFNQTQTGDGVMFRHRRNIPIICGKPSAIGVHNSILIVAARQDHAGFVCAMTKDGRILWRTVDKNIISFGQCNIHINNVTNEIFLYSLHGFFRKVYDFISGREKTDFKNWRFGGMCGAFVINAQNETMLCHRTVDELIIVKIASNDNDKLLGVNTIVTPTPTRRIQQSISSGFCAGGRGELIIYDDGKLYIIK